MLLYLAACFLEAHTVQVSRPFHELGWRRETTAPDGATSVSFTLSLKQQQLDVLKRQALLVSTPGAASYGKFYSMEEIDALTAPPPTAYTAVKAWLDAEAAHFSVLHECIRVTTSVATAERLLSTRFSYYQKEQRRLLRAGAYTLPPAVASVTGTIFGLHGLPAPRAPPLLHAGASKPANVTPTVIYATYSIGNYSVNKTNGNLQAVAEFQDQYMNQSDLRAFFRAEVYGYGKGDDEVSKYVGAPNAPSRGVGLEAMLDIEYLMGVATGVRTQFWEWPAQDFCGDLHNYTAALLRHARPPRVNSISYGWQGNLSDIHCEPADVRAVELNLLKLAARGISLIVSSGDSGSGYAKAACSEASGTAGLEVTSGLNFTLSGPLGFCCEQATYHSAQAWTWYPTKDPSAQAANASQQSAPPFQHPPPPTPPPTPPPAPPPAPAKYTFKDAEFHVEPGSEGGSAFPVRDVHILNGQLDREGGQVQLHVVNGTFADTAVAFSPPYYRKEYPPSLYFFRNMTMQAGGATFRGVALFDNVVPPFFAYRLSWYPPLKPGSHLAGATLLRGPNPAGPPPPPAGRCHVYSSASKWGPSSRPGVVSGGPAIDPASSIALYPSWPASSPWVTAVGATTFVNGRPYEEEMVVDRFGSGGGFSHRFHQSDAPWQVDAVAKYVAQGARLPKFPPRGAFPPLGRATPDVAALGEGFQVVYGGKLTSVGGTSAAAPTVAAMVTLLNEARLQAGKPPMGFLNPFLYANPDAFFDVVKGTNAYGRGPYPVPFGFAAAPGWDAASGLGTPHYDKLLAAAMKAAPV